VSVTVCIKGIRAPIFAAAARTGRPLPELAAIVGVMPTLLGDGSARVPHALVSHAWELLAQTCNDESFGIFAAEVLEGAPIDFVDYALRHHPTVADVSKALGRWQRLFHDANDCVAETSRDEDEVTWVQRLKGDLATSRHMREFILATWIVRLRRWTGVHLVPRSVSFRHAPPRDTERAATFFGVEPSYRAARDQIVVGTDVSRAALAGVDDTMRALFEQHVEQERLRRDGDAALVDRVRAEIQRGLGVGKGDLAAVSRALAVSSRTLQRRLGTHGTSFQAILDDERRIVAIDRMARAGAVVTDVAFLLGFSDTTAFSRAFRRWTGQTPSEFRARVA
jgi:AraC-like DNA-binding protein